MKKSVYTLTGAGIALASVAAISGYAIGKNKDKDPSGAILAAGIVGMIAGAALAVAPEILKLRKKLLSAKAEETEEELIDEAIDEEIDEEIDEALYADEEEAAAAAELMLLEESEA